MIKLSQKQLNLLKYIDKNSHKSRLDNFKLFANEHAVSYKSIRNEYYKILKNMKKEDYEFYHLNYHNFIVEPHELFSNQELSIKIEKVMDLYKNGHSLRQSCMIVANNDKKLALRYQNKIRNMNLYRKTKIITIPANKIANSNSNSNQDTKLFNMPLKNSYVSDQDITNLFMGLVRLVKRTTENNIKERIKAQFSNANKKLYEVMNTLERENIKNNELEKENATLRHKLEQYENDIKLQEMKYLQKISSLENILSKFMPKQDTKIKR